MNKTILVTGAAGFIGGEIVRELVERGFNVIAIDNFLRGTRDNMLHHSRVTYIPMDVRDTKRFTSFGKEAEVILNLAARSSVRKAEEDRDQTWSTNSTWLWDGLTTLAKAGTRYVIQYSSREVYAADARMPANEATKLGGINLYGVSKLRAEEVINRVVAAQRGFKATLLRLGNIIGADYYEPPYGRVIPTWVTNAREGRPITVIGGEHKSLDFLHVTYVVEATMRLIERHFNKKGIYEPINLASGQAITLGQLARTIQQHYPSLEIQEKPSWVNETQHFQADVSRMKGWLGLMPPKDPLEGIENFTFLQGHPPKEEPKTLEA